MMMNEIGDPDYYSITEMTEQEDSGTSALVGALRARGGRARDARPHLTYTVGGRCYHSALVESFTFTGESIQVAPGT